PNGVTCSEVQFLMQACWKYVCAERTAEDSVVEWDSLTATRLIQCGAFICRRSMGLFGHVRPIVCRALIV
ncbi:MAG: hypothetical protein U0236_17885, partial [Nitrospira sp.]